MPLHDTHYSFAKLLAEAGYVKIVPHSYNADTKHVSVEFAGSDDEYKAACAAVRPLKSEPTITETKEEKRMDSKFSASQVVDLIREAMVAPSAQYIDRVVEKPVEKIVEKIVYKDGPSTIPEDYEQLKKDLETARKTASTWQSKYTTLYAEFEAYKAAHENTAASAAPAVTVPVSDECPFEDAHPVSEAMYSLKPAAPATPAPATPAPASPVTPAAPEHKTFEELFPDYEYIPFVADPSDTFGCNNKYTKVKGYALADFIESIKNKYGARKDLMQCIVAFDFGAIMRGREDHSRMTNLAYAIFEEVQKHYNDKVTKKSKDSQEYSLFTREYLESMVRVYNDCVDRGFVNSAAPAAPATSAPKSSAVDFDDFEVD